MEIKPPNKKRAAEIKRQYDAIVQELERDTKNQSEYDNLLSELTQHLSSTFEVFMDLEENHASAIEDKKWYNDVKTLLLLAHEKLPMTEARKKV